MPTIGEENLRLQLYDHSYEPYGDVPLRTFHDGHIGDSQEKLFFVRNHNPSKWYTNIQLTPIVVGGYDNAGEFGVTGWGVKLMYGRRRPTEEEWDYVKSGSTIVIPDIGSCEAADTFTNHPIWIRIYCPGGEKAHIRENMQIKITYLVKEVGSCLDKDLAALMELGYEGVFAGPYAIYGLSTLGSSAGGNGYFYPIYLTEAAAENADVLSGGSGVAHPHTFYEYKDATFYMPEDNANHVMSSSGGYPVYGSDYGGGTSGSSSSSSTSSGSGIAAVGTITVYFAEGMENTDYVLIKSTDGTEIKYKFNFESDADCVGLNLCTGIRDDSASPPIVHVNLGGVSDADVVATRLKTAITGTTGHSSKILVAGPVDGGSGEQVLTLTQAVAGITGNTTIVYYQEENPGGDLEITVDGFADGDDSSGGSGDGY